MELSLGNEWQPLVATLLCILFGYFIARHFTPSYYTRVTSRSETLAHSSAVPPECAHICEFLAAKELAVVQLVSKDWWSAARHRIRVLLLEKIGGEALQQLPRASLSQRLCYLETKDLIPLWADKPMAERSGSDIPCPRLGHLVMQMMKHSKNSEWDTFHTGVVKSLFEIHPRENLEEHPFGALKMSVWEDSNLLQLLFVRDLTTTATWSFKIVDRTWYLTGQSCYMKTGFKICNSWSPERPLDQEAYRPEFRERNPKGVGILEEASMFWHELQQHFLEPDYQVARKPFCSLSSCGVLRAKKRCSRCQLSFYCSREHQSEHWKEHKLICEKLPPLADTISAYEHVEHGVRDQTIDVFSMIRRKAMDWTGREWYVN